MEPTKSILDTLNLRQIRALSFLEDYLFDNRESILDKFGIDVLGDYLTIKETAESVKEILGLEDRVTAEVIVLGEILHMTNGDWALDKDENKYKWHLKETGFFYLLEKLYDKLLKKGYLLVSFMERFALTDYYKKDDIATFSTMFYPVETEELKLYLDCWESKEDFLKSTNLVQNYPPDAHHVNKLTRVSTVAEPTTVFDKIDFSKINFQMSDYVNAFDDLLPEMKALNLVMGVDGTFVVHIFLIDVTTDVERIVSVIHALDLPLELFRYMVIPRVTLDNSLSTMNGDWIHLYMDKNTNQGYYLTNDPNNPCTNYNDVQNDDIYTVPNEKIPIYNAPGRVILHKFKESKGNLREQIKCRKPVEKVEPTPGRRLTAQVRDLFENLEAIQIDRKERTELKNDN